MSSSCNVYVSMDQSQITPGKKNTKRKSSSLTSSRKISEPFVSPLLSRQGAQNKEELDNQACKRIKFDNSCNQKKTETETERDNKEESTKPINKYQAREKSVSTDKQLKNLQSLLEEKQDTLRKLNMVKMYRKKNNLCELQQLIDKWRKVSQEAAIRLLDSVTTVDKLTMTQLLDQLQINHQLIQYSAEEEGFLSN